MNRGITLFGASLLVSLAARSRRRRRPPRGRRRRAASAGPEVRGRPDVAQADGQSMDPRIVGGRGGRLARPRVHGSHDRHVHAAHRDRPRDRPAYRRVLRSAPNVLEYDAAGALVNHWGGPGDGYDWPAQNTGLAIDDSRQRVDRRRGRQDSRILKFSRDGKFIAEFGKAPAVAAGAVGAGARRRTPRTPACRLGAARLVAAAAAAGAAVAWRPSAAPREQQQHGQLRRRGGLLVRQQGERSVRRRRLAQSPRRGDRHDTGAIKRFWGAYGAKPNDADTAKYEPGGAAPKQFGSPSSAPSSRTTGSLYVCDTHERSHSGIQEGRIVREGEGHRAGDARQRDRCGTSRSRATRSSGTSTSPMART